MRSVAEDDLDLLVLLPGLQSAAGIAGRQASPRLLYTVLRIKPRTSSMVGKHSPH